MEGRCMPRSRKRCPTKNHWPLYSGIDCKSEGHTVEIEMKKERRRERCYPFTRILCPTDFSEPSYEAIKAASELASHFESELCIVHVISPVPIPMGAEPSAFNVSLYEQELEVSSKRSLEEVFKKLESKDLKAR